jgi:hypothetical protein
VSTNPDVFSSSGEIIFRNMYSSEKVLEMSYANCTLILSLFLFFAN